MLLTNGINMPKKIITYRMPDWVHKDTYSTINNLPNPFGTFKKAKYVIYGYNKIVVYSCVTTCRSEENILKILTDWLRVTYTRKEYAFALIVKYQESEEKVLFRGNVYIHESK